MAELTVEQLIKLIIGVLVVVAVVVGLYLLFKYRIINFFNGLPSGNLSKLILTLIK